MKRFPARRELLSRQNVTAAGVAVAALGALAGWVAVKARHAEQASPPRGKFLTIDGVRLHYLESGEGTPVILLHGNLLRAEDFVASGVFEQLARTHRVIAFDRPGYGYSDRPMGRRWTARTQAALLRRAWERLGIAQPVVVGHSWGTLVALELALLPDTVSQLVLVSGYYFPTLRADVLAAAPAAIPILGTLLRYTVAPVFARLTLNRVVQAMFGPVPVPENFLPALDRELLVRPKQIHSDAQDAVYMIAGAARLKRHYREIRVPVMIFAGAEDQVVDESQARELQQAIIGSELRVVPGAGHMVHHTIPTAIVAAVDRWA